MQYIWPPLTPLLGSDWLGWVSIIGWSLNYIEMIPNLDGSGVSTPESVHISYMMEGRTAGGSVYGFLKLATVGVATWTTSSDRPIIGFSLPP